jgi:hypothetical protein
MRFFRSISAFSFLLIPFVLSALEVPTEKRTAPVTGIINPASKLIQQWYNEGTAAGNIGDFYDNRDRGHANVSMKRFPQVTKITYTHSEIIKKRDWGGAQVVYNDIVVGNSSTARNIHQLGSNARALYYHNDPGINFLYYQYNHNNLFAYPEHVDYDSGHNGNPGHGDVFPVNTPYIIISKGSSGTDAPFIDSVLYALGAFRPDVKKFLKERGLLAPTIQQILRSTSKALQSPDDYLTGIAHPTVFDGKNLDLVKMVKAAHDLRLGTVPPVSQLRVVNETFDTAKIQSKEEKNEVLANTPCVISRVMRSLDYEKTITVSAAKSFDANKLPLTYHWKVLRGDAERIKIIPSEDGAEATLIIPYHERRPIYPGSDMESNRVDIGIFVHNGINYSAPSFVTVFFLDNEQRTYNEKKQLVEIFYDAHTYDYSVNNWIGFFNLMRAEAKTYPVQMLQGFFSEEEKFAIAEIASQSDSFFPAKMTKKVRGHLKKINNGKNLKEIEEAIDQAVSSPNPAFGGSSLKERVIVFCDSIKNNLVFYPTHAHAIEQWLSTSKQKWGRNDFLRSRDLLNNQGIMTKTADNEYVIQSVLSRGLGHEQKLSTYEKEQVSKFNLLILTELFYPQFLKFHERANFVDKRLSEPKPWRDVYYYDPTGEKLTSWTRFDGKKLKTHKY